MDELSLGVPRQILESLPEAEDDAAADMQSAVAAWENRLNRMIEDAPTDTEAASRVVDAIERFEDRQQQYDQFVAELRAWGQSPIYAIGWRNLYADLIAQVYDHEDVASHLDRERNARLVEDGIRIQDTE
jgi:chemotaxis regulatin CheY-phosphate phosphatase CheZ